MAYSTARPDETLGLGTKRRNDIPEVLGGNPGAEKATAAASEGNKINQEYARAAQPVKDSIAAIKKTQKAYADQQAQKIKQEQAMQDRKAGINTAIGTAMTGVEDIGRRNIAEGLARADAGTSRRGLLYGGINQEARGDETAAALQALSERQAQIRDQGEQLFNSDADVNYSGLLQDTVNKYNSASNDYARAQQDSAYATKQRLNDSQDRSSLAQGIAGVVGTGLGYANDYYNPKVAKKVGA